MIYNDFCRYKYHYLRLLKDTSMQRTYKKEKKNPRLKAYKI